MKVLVVGSGGREHALCWKIAQSARVEQIFCAPGNGGTAVEAKVQNVAIKADDIPALVAFAQKENIGLTMIGPEDPLSKGIVNAFEEAGLRVFGPRKDAAQIEASKAFAKELMVAANIPTAKYAEFTALEPAKAYVLEQGAPIVVKADGLAAGKGVTVAMTVEEAVAALEDIFVGNVFGEAGSKVVIEEYLAGEEASYLAFTDGNFVLPMASSQDHKAIYDGDKGPNTGGMGAYSPAPVLTQEHFDFTTQNIAYPLINELKKRGIVFKGIIYAGLMITTEGPKVIEFNARFGDPETQPVLTRMESDIVPILEAGIDGTLDKAELKWKQDPAICVVLAAGGYPRDYAKGDEITGFDEANAVPNAKVFHAGTIEKDGKILTAGGRVLGVTATGETLEKAIESAYRACEKMQYKGKYNRTDIGQKALRRMRGE